MGVKISIYSCVFDLLFFSFLIKLTGIDSQLTKTRPFFDYSNFNGDIKILDTLVDLVKGS